MLYNKGSFFTSGTYKAIVDSGTSMITVPVAAFKQYKAMLDTLYPKEEIYC